MSTYYELAAERLAWDEGFFWAPCRETGSYEDMVALAQHWARLNGQAKAKWDREDPRYREAFRPEYRGIRLSRIEAHKVKIDLGEAEAEGYREKAKEIEARHRALRQEAEAQERAQYERLRAKYECLRGWHR